jgi:methionyl-tRNA formyltransferase
MDDNPHTGDLPRYRGNACPDWAIIAGEEKTDLIK